MIGGAAGRAFLLRTGSLWRRGRQAEDCRRWEGASPGRPTGAETREVPGRVPALALAPAPEPAFLNSGGSWTGRWLLVSWPFFWPFVPLGRQREPEASSSSPSLRPGELGFVKCTMSRHKFISTARLGSRGRGCRIGVFCAMVCEQRPATS